MANIAKQFRDRHPGANVVKRTRNAIHVETAPGKFVCELHMRPIFTLAGAEIDTAWQPDSGTYQHQMAQADYKAQAKAAFNGAPLVRYEHVASGQFVTLQPRQLDYSNDRGDVQLISAVQSVTATVDDDVLLWTGAYGAGRDFKWQASTDMLAKELILQTAAAAPTPSAQVLGGANPILRLAYTFAFSSGISPFIDGVEWSRNSTETTSGAIEFRLSDGTVAWRFAVPHATDANGETAPGLVQRLSRSGPNLLCEVRVPWSWLQSAAYPVSIDPTLTLQPDETDGVDTFILSNVPTTNFGVNGEMRVGEQNNEVDAVDRGLIKFDLSTIEDTDVISSAVLTLTVSRDFSSTARTLRVYRCKRAWVENQATWNIYSTGNNWAAAGGFHADDTEQTDIGSLALSDSETGAKAVSLTPTSKAALDLGNGWMLKMDTELNDCYFWYSASAVTSTNRPKLVVEYSEAAAPAAPSNLVVVAVDLTPPGDLGAVAISDTEIDLSWTDSAICEDGYKIERAPAGTGTWAQIDDIAAPATGYSDTGLAPVTAYDYRIRAYAGAVNGAYSNTATETTEATPYAGPFDGITFAALYGLKRFLTAYTGPLIRLRRSSDNAESDFGYVEATGLLDTAAIATWAGADSLFVVTWYDQSGGTNDVTQSTAGSQPAYVASAVNSLPSAQFDGTNDVLTRAFDADMNPAALTLFAVAAKTGGGNAYRGIFNSRDGTSAGYLLYSDDGATRRAEFWTANGSHRQLELTSPTLTDNTHYIFCASHDGGAQGSAVKRLWVNGGTPAANTDGYTPMTFPRPANVGSGEGAFLWFGYITMIALAPSDLSVANKNTIGNELATLYGLTWGTVS